jgi:hypothetical protein
MTTTAPTRRVMLANFLIFQLAWFAAVLGAAHGRPIEGTACVLAAIGWHLAVSRRPAVEARLVLAALLLGCVAESAMVAWGPVEYTSGQPWRSLPPYWIVALWGLLAISLNVTLRWLKGRPWLAAALGAVAGPMSFAAGVRLGAGQFMHPAAATVALACLWACALPSLMALSVRYDGVGNGDAEARGAPAADLTGALRRAG